MANEEVNRIIKEKFFNRFCDEYIYIGRDNTCMAKYYNKYIDVIKNFEIKDDDVFVATYPKTGTTWAQEMVWMIGNDLDYEKAKASIKERFPYLEVCGVGDFGDEENPENKRNSIEYAKQLESPRFIKTHLSFPLLPEQIQNGTKKPKIIYVVRNAKDVCVSYYHHSRLIEGIKANLEEFTKVFMSGKEMYGPFWKHIFGYWEHRDWPNMLIIKYEDMKKDIKSVIKTVAKFLDKKLNEDQIERLSKHLSFESMKSNPAIDYDSFIEQNRKEGFVSDEGSFFRRGTVGQYKEELSSEMINRLNNWIKDNISGTSFEKIYDYSL